MENPIKIDDLGVPLFLETSIFKISQNTYIDYIVQFLCIPSRWRLMDVVQLLSWFVSQLQSYPQELENLF